MAGVPMNYWDAGRTAYLCEAISGLDFRQVFDLEEVEHLLKEMGKTYVSPVLDPSLNDFTPSNCFWLFAERDGSPIVGGGVRLDKLHGTDVNKFWSKFLHRAFGEAPREIGSPFPDDVLAGNVAYFGDLLSSGNTTLGRFGRDKLRYFTYVGHYLTQQHFAPDVTYCFVQDKDYLRGTPGVYGFLDHEPFLYKWNKNPYPQGEPGWVSYLSKRKFEQLSEVMKRAIEAEVRKIELNTHLRPRSEDA